MRANQQLHRPWLRIRSETTILTLTIHHDETICLLTLMTSHSTHKAQRIKVVTVSTINQVEASPRKPGEAEIIYLWVSLLSWPH